MKPSRLIQAFVVSFVFLAVVVSGQNGPGIPSWVHPGLTVSYDGVSAFMRNGQPTQSVQVVMTTRVPAVAGGRVSAATTFQTVGTPLRNNAVWSCTATGNCTGTSAQFWVDPANPTASFH